MELSSLATFEIRNPNLEIRNKSECSKSKIQNPKSQPPSRRPILSRFLVSGFSILSLALLSPAPALGKMMADSTVIFEEPAISCGAGKGYKFQEQAKHDGGLAE